MHLFATNPYLRPSYSSVTPVHGTDLLGIFANARSVSPQPAPPNAPPDIPNVIPDDIPNVIPPVIPNDLPAFATQTLNFTPDPIRSEILTADPHRAIINCTRQWGKSTLGAIKALHQSLLQPGSLTLIASRTRAQAAGILDKVKHFAGTLNLDLSRVRNYPASLEFPNKSRIIAIPRDPATSRGFSAVSLIIVDEAAFADPDLYEVLKPTLATTDGPVWLLSTPNGPSGLFFEIWNNPGPENWQRFSVPATDCPRISQKFLESERRSKSPTVFAREYMCEFTPSEGAVFDTSALSQGNTMPSINPVFEAPSEYYIGLDIGQLHSQSALVVLRHVTEVTNHRDPVTFEFIREERIVLTHHRTFELNTPYEEVIFRIDMLISKLGLRGKESVTLVYDATGCGQMFPELLKKDPIDATLAPIHITSGSMPTYSNGIQRVPKADLFADLRYLLAHPRFHYNAGNATDLVQALSNIQHLQSASGRAQFKSTGPDDLAMAFALAAWRARRVIAKLPT